jgi:phospholipid/cholesterol/gamma-HCH transport system permease protein
MYAASVSVLGRDVAPQAGSPAQRFATELRASKAYAKIESAGDMLSLALSVVRLAVKPPFAWRRDALIESSLIFRRCLVPLVICLSVFVIANGVLLLGNVLAGLGAADRQAGGIYLGVLREVCTWITMMVFAGVAGSAVAADLGARKVREELDALSVLGVEAVRTLVVPRVIAFTFSAVILGLVALFVAVFGDFCVAPRHFHLSNAIFIDSVRHNVIPLDLYASAIKYTIIGFFVGVVTCTKGLRSEGGSEGVGRAVNQTVVITFFGIWLINSFYNLAFLSLFPDASVLRG